jgi:hypothetical protein
MNSKDEANTGFLAIWSDVTFEQETDYIHWLTREHTAERLGVEGFAGVRVYRSVQTDICRYFIRYALAAPAVLASAAYLARLNEPTPWSQRIMPILGNFARGGGRVLARAGVGHGGIVAALKLESLSLGQHPAALERIVAGLRIVRAELLETDLDTTAIKTREKSLRERDTSFAGLLLIEGTDVSAVADAADRLKLGALGNIYSLVFQL